MSDAPSTPEASAPLNSELKPEPLPMSAQKEKKRNEQQYKIFFRERGKKTVVNGTIKLTSTSMACMPAAYIMPDSHGDPMPLNEQDTHDN